MGGIVVEKQTWIAAKAVLSPGTRVEACAVVGLGAGVSGVVSAGAIVRGDQEILVGRR